MCEEYEITVRITGLEISFRQCTYIVVTLNITTTLRYLDLSRAGVARPDFRRVRPVHDEHEKPFSQAIPLR